MGPRRALSSRTTAHVTRFVQPASDGRHNYIVIEIHRRIVALLRTSRHRVTLGQLEERRKGPRVIVPPPASGPIDSCRTRQSSSVTPCLGLRDEPSHRWARSLRPPKGTTRLLRFGPQLSSTRRRLPGASLGLRSGPARSRGWRTRRDELPRLRMPSTHRVRVASDGDRGKPWRGRQRTACEADLLEPPAS